MGLPPVLEGGRRKRAASDLLLRTGLFFLKYLVPFSQNSRRATIEELARTEGILLDPVYTGKAFAGMMQLLRQGAFDGQDDLLFVHTGGTAALFAIDLPR